MKDDDTFDDVPIWVKLILLVIGMLVCSLILSFLGNVFIYRLSNALVKNGVVIVVKDTVTNQVEVVK